MNSSASKPEPFASFLHVDNGKQSFLVGVEIFVKFQEIVALVV